MRVRRTAFGAATSECRTKPIAASFFGSGYNCIREQVAPPLPYWVFVPTGKWLSCVVLAIRQLSELGVLLMGRVMDQEFPCAQIP
jgi:hypothetical protein